MPKKNNNEFCEIVEADYLGEHKLFLKFNDGLKDEIDLADFVKDGVFKPLQDPKNSYNLG